MLTKTPDTQIKYIYGFIVIVAICMVGSYYKKKKTEEKINALIAIRNQEPAQVTPQDLEGEQPQELEQIEDFAPTSKNVEQSAQKLTDPNQQSIESLQKSIDDRSDQAFKQFSNEVHLSFKAPGNFKYITLDTDDGFSGIYGEDGVQKSKVTGLAYGKTVTKDQVVQFLKSGQEGIPNFSNNPIQNLSAPAALPPAPANSGIDNATLWTGKLANGDQVNAVFLERQDKKGVYLFVLSGPDSYFKNNDGSFDSLYESLQTTNPK